MGLTEDEIEKLITAGVSSLASVTFFTTDQSGTPDDTPLITSLKTALAVPQAVLIQVRRLLFEAHVVFLADLKLWVTATDDDVPKRILALECAARHLDQKALS